MKSKKIRPWQDSQSLSSIANDPLLGTLHKAELQVYLRLLASRDRYDVPMTPRVTTLSGYRVYPTNDDLHETRSTAVAALRRLEKLGLIRVSYKGRGGGSNRGITVTR